MGRAHIARIENELAGAKVFGSSGELIASDAADAVLVTSFGPAQEEAVPACRRVRRRARGPATRQQRVPHHPTGSPDGV